MLHACGQYMAHFPEHVHVGSLFTTCIWYLLSSAMHFVHVPCSAGIVTSGAAQLVIIRYCAVLEDPTESHKQAIKRLYNYMTEKTYRLSLRLM